jgi:hypothetical protein
MSDARRSYRPPPVAANEDDAPVRAPETARAARRAAPREERDLFAEQNFDDAPQSASAPKTGERAENSVLFSLDVLRQQESQQQLPEVRPREASMDTIDLNAISALNGGSLAYKPLDLSEPVMGNLVELPDVATPGMKTWQKAAIGGGAVALIAGVLLFFGLRADTTPVALKTADITLAPATLDAPLRVRAKLEDPAALAAAANVSVPGAGRRLGAPMSGARMPSGNAGGSKAPPTSAPPPPVSKPAPDKCGCHGVLACVIRCSATGK